MAPELLNVEEIAKILRLHVMTVYRLVKGGTSRFQGGWALEVSPQHSGELEGGPGSGGPP